MIGTLTEQQSRIASALRAASRPLQPRDILEAVDSIGSKFVVNVQIHKMRAKGVPVKSMGRGRYCVGYWLEG